ncbi:hypothetical protein ABZZ16_28065 [Streptomyces sp. NPDC006386]|uniref:hypothetical protein n=1 Tax=Streptomyces sp. NPDC006386 TaxID=3156762 RepID=UPI0033B20A71
MSVSDYTETEGLPAKDRKPYKAWSYDVAGAKLYIPRLAGGQEGWFAAALSTERGRALSRLAVFAERPQHKRWEMVFVVDLDSQKLPGIALDREGYATAVTATDNKQLAADANVLRTAVLDNFATGGTNSGSKVFAPTKASKQQIKVHDETGTRFGNQGTTVFDAADNRYNDAYALKTADGGALVLFSHTHTQTDAVAHSGLQINPGKGDRAWLHDVPRTSIRYTFVCNDAATAPAKAEPSRLIGYACARTDASGPRPPPGHTARSHTRPPPRRPPDTPGPCSLRRTPCPHTPSSPAPPSARGTAASTSSSTVCPATISRSSWPPTSTSSDATSRPCPSTSSTTSPSAGTNSAPISSTTPHPRSWPR